MASSKMIPKLYVKITKNKNKSILIYKLLYLQSYLSVTLLIGQIKTKNLNLLYQFRNIGKILLRNLFKIKEKRVLILLKQMLVPLKKTRKKS